MTNLLERFEAQLTTLTSAIENVYADAVRLQTIDEHLIKAEIPGLLERVEAQSRELKEFDCQLRRNP